MLLVKIGGSTLGSQDTTFEDLVALQKQGVPVVVVHGGGAVITDWLKKQGVATRFVNGRRVTDEPTLATVVAVLAGLVNSEIVAKVNSLGGKAVGLSGVDGPLLEAGIREPELGLVGEVVKVNTRPVEMLLAAGYIPVIAPLGLMSGADGKGQILNVNADTAAAEIAIALKAESFVLLTDVAGVMDKSGKVFDALTVHEANTLIASGVASGGMIPKLEACFKAVERVPRARIIDGRQAHALRGEVEGVGGGTTITQ
ncbi:MAG: acetylglutamate kinase [Chloroflexi bacterium]|nr:acetylglutamate kinase [Chloroflexota bacterium]